MSSDSVIDRIRDGVGRIIAPNGSAPDPFRPDLPALDNVAWHDFSEYRHVLEPVFQGRKGTGAQSPPTDAELEPAADLEEEGVSSGHLQLFMDRLRAAVHAKYERFEDYTVVEIEGTKATLEGGGGGGHSRTIVDGGPGSEDPQGFKTNPRKMKELGFSAQEATGRVMAVLGTSLALEDLFTTFSLIPVPARDDLIAAVVEMLPHDEEGLPKAYTGTWTEQPQGHFEYDDNYELIMKAVALGEPGENPTLDGELALKWGTIAAEMADRFESGMESGELDEPPVEEPDTGDGDRPRQGRPASYPFELYDPGTVNLGLRLLYRQEWRPVGSQRGEIVRTIPLGPKQTDKVSTKIVRRLERSRTAEQLRSVESTTETTDSTKDSSEVVREASETFGWEFEAEASAKWGWGKASASFGADYEAEQRSKDTSSRISEAVKKTANKIHTETKIVVTTEAESEFEATTSSEISNPNEEIAVTYVYSRLQRQYETFTALAEVEDVVMVAERVPRPSEIDEDWIRRHDWILARALLDDSFRDALAAISQEVPSSSTAVLQSKARDVLDKTVLHLGTMAGTATNVALSQTDPTQEAQRGYREVMREKAEARRRDRLLQQKKERLKEHVRDNILHYCRAIWSAEDPDQRLLRYRRERIRVPTVYQVDTGGQAISLADLRDGLEVGEEVPIFLRFIPVSDPATDLPLADLIRADGPVGFHGNYAIFRLKPQFGGEAVLPVLDFLKSSYLYTGSAACGSDDPWLVQADPAGAFIDPELKRLRTEFADSELPGEPWKSPAVQRAMVRMVPHLRVEYEIARVEDELAVEEGEEPTAVADFFADTDLFRGCYPDYVFRERRTHRFLVETNNLVLDLVPGAGSALEQFKLSHRGVDVMKALEEQRRMALENQRRQALLEEGNFGDPDIEKVTIVADPDGQLGPVNVSIAHEDSDEDGGA